MKKFEKILLIVAAVGVAMKLLHVPLNGPVLILSLSALAISYFPLGYFVLGRPDRKSQVPVTSILSGLAFNMAVMGLLFKVQHWPLTAFYLVYGCFCSLIVLVWAFLKKRKRPELHDYFDGLLQRAVLYVLLTGALYSIPGRKLLEWQYPNEPERVNVLDSLRNHDDDRRTHESLVRRLEEMDRKKQQ